MIYITLFGGFPLHYSDVIMSVMASKLTGLSTVFSTVCSGVRRSKKTSKLRVTGLCVGNSSVTAQRASNAENVSIWWRHHGWYSFKVYSSVCCFYQHNIDGLVQDCSNSIDNAPELLQCCTKLLIWCMLTTTWGPFINKEYPRLCHG